MVRHGGSSASSYLADHTSPIPSHCASIVLTSPLRVKECTVINQFHQNYFKVLASLLYNKHNFFFKPLFYSPSQWTDTLQFQHTISYIIHLETQQNFHSRTTHQPVQGLLFSHSLDRYFITKIYNFNRTHLKIQQKSHSWSTHQFHFYEIW